MCSHTHTPAAAQKIGAHNKITHKYTPVYMYTRWHTQARVADPNPGTHTFLIPHNCFQSKGSCLSGPRRGLIARYKILRRVGKAAGRQKEREGERDMVCTYFSSLSPLTFFSSCTWCRNLGSVNKGWKKPDSAWSGSYRFGGKTFVLNTSEVCQTQES